jgi:hypothetical protein
MWESVDIGILLARDTAVSVFGVMKLPEYRYAAVAIHIWTRPFFSPDSSYDRCELRRACGVEISVPRIPLVISDAPSPAS